MTDLADWEVCEFVAVAYEHNWYPGQIMHLNEDKTATVNCMKYVDINKSSNKFTWPTKKDEGRYDLDELILKLDNPVPIQGKRR